MERAPAFNVPPAVVWLALAFAAVHGVRQFLSDEAETWVLLAFAFIPARYGPFGRIPAGRVRRRASGRRSAMPSCTPTCIHLIVNLIWMASFGSALARRFGSARFLALSLISAVAGAGLHYVFHMADEGAGHRRLGRRLGNDGGGSPLRLLAGRAARRRAGRRPPIASPAEPLATVFTSSRALGFILVWFAINFLFGTCRRARSRRVGTDRLGGAYRRVRGGARRLPLPRPDLARAAAGRFAGILTHTRIHWREKPRHGRDTGRCG